MAKVKVREWDGAIRFGKMGVVAMSVSRRLHIPVVLPIFMLCPLEIHRGGAIKNEYA